jgi:hypothetical protein
MHQRDYEPGAAEAATDSAGAGISRQIEVLLRWAAQLLGFLLILIGLYGVIHVFSAVGRAVRDPATLEPAVTSMAQLINSEALEITLDGRKLVLGRPVTMVALLLWYVVWGWLAIAMLSTGAKLVFAVMKERREHLAAMKELMITARQELTFREPARGKPASET